MLVSVTDHDCDPWVNQWSCVSSYLLFRDVPWEQIKSLIWVKPPIFEWLSSHLISMVQPTSSCWLHSLSATCHPVLMPRTQCSTGVYSFRQVNQAGSSHPQNQQIRFRGFWGAFSPLFLGRETVSDTRIMKDHICLPSRQPILDLAIFLMLRYTVRLMNVKHIHIHWIVSTDYYFVYNTCVSVQTNLYLSARCSLYWCITFKFIFLSIWSDQIRSDHIKCYHTI